MIKALYNAKIVINYITTILGYIKLGDLSVQTAAGPNSDFLRLTTLSIGNVRHSVQLNHNN